MRTPAPTVRLDARKVTKRGTTATPAAPAAPGPCGEAIVAGGLVFCSGLVGTDPVTGLPGDGVEAQTRLALRNLGGILAAAGTSLAAVASISVRYADAADLPAIYAVYARVLTGLPPARSGPARGTLPPGLLLLVGAVAVVPADPAARSQNR
jgi:2-iminobutanoate/2-iminopropanoate deaminase